jgi:hypothetical protein
MLIVPLPGCGHNGQDNRGWIGVKRLEAWPDE